MNEPRNRSQSAGYGQDSSAHSGGKYGQPHRGESSSRRTSDQIRADIERTRAQMDRTVDEIEERLTPEQIMKRMACAVGHGASNVAKSSSRKAVNMVREHPIPAAVVGAGLVLLFIARRKQRQRKQRQQRESYEGYDYETGRYRGTGISQAVESNRGQYAGEFEYGGSGPGKAREKLSSVRERVAQTTSHAKEKLHEAGDYAREKAHDAKEYARSAVHQTGEAVSNVGHKIQRGAHQTREWFDEALEDYPLAVGAGFFALGLAGGLSVPTSRKEKEILGPMREKIVDQAQSVGSELLERGQELAERVVSAAKEAATSETGEDDKSRSQSQTQGSQQRQGSQQGQQQRGGTSSASSSGQGSSGSSQSVQSSRDIGGGAGSMSREHGRNDSSGSGGSSSSPQAGSQGRQSQRSPTSSGGPPPPTPGV